MSTPVSETARMRRRVLRATADLAAARVAHGERVAQRLASPPPTSMCSAGSPSRAR